MTVNHDYNTPEQGETNWDVPLNENFRRLEVDVEIRDERSTLHDYEPKQGSKFLATDTGEVFVGDGSNWRSLGTLSNESSQSDGTIVASPGDVQSALDDAAIGTDWAHNQYCCVTLESGQIYEPTGTWQVPKNTILDFNGALVKPNHSEDVLRVGPRAEIRNPHIDARQTSWSDATMIHVDTKYGGKVSGPHGSPIYNARLFCPNGAGDGIRLQDSTGDGMGGFRVTGLLHGFDRALHLYANGGGSSFVNGITAQIRVSNYRIGVRQESTNDDAANNGHFFIVDTQPRDDYTEWLWRQGPGDHSNTMMAQTWDTSRYENETVWFLPSDIGFNNVLVDLFQFIGDWQVVDRKGSDTNGVFRWLDGSFQRRNR